MASPRPTILNSPSSSHAAFLASSLPPLRQCHPSALQRTSCCPVSLREGCVSTCALEMGWGWGEGLNTFSRAILVWDANCFTGIVFLVCVFPAPGHLLRCLRSYKLWSRKELHGEATGHTPSGGCPQGALSSPDSSSLRPGVSEAPPNSYAVIFFKYII